MNTRDPQSFLALRRLAGRAQRSEEARAVLHDALLETLPSYEKAIAEADERSEGGRNPWNVWFFPTRLNRTTRKYGTTHLAFEAHRAFVDLHDLQGSRSRSNADTARAVVVYETIPTRYLVYIDPDGDGRGEVIDHRTYRVMGQRRRQPSWLGHWSMRSQSKGALDTAFLRWMREQLLTRYTREALIAWLQWNDPNGAYSDEDAWREGQPPLTHGEAADLAFEHVLETKETLEEMRRNARR